MRNHTRRLSALVLAALMLLALSACGSKANDTESETLPVIDLDLPVSTSSVEPYNPDEEPATSAETGTESETETGSETEPGTETESETGSETESETGTESEPSSEVGALAMTTASVNVRKSAGGDVLMQLPKGALVNLLDVSNAEWYQVSFNGTSGFISAEYLDTKTSAKEMSITGTVTTTSLNVREKAASDGKAIGSLSKDATCTIVAAENGWYKIKFDNGYGYVSSDYVKLVTN